MDCLNQISERVTQRRLMEAVISQTDSEGRRLADRFMKLPLRDEYPHYYDKITTPMDIQTISSKVENGLYADLNELERDFLLMLYNAQKFNETDPVISRDSVVLQNLFLEEKKRLEREKQTLAVIEKVLGMDLLLDMIIDLAIHDAKKDRAVSNRRSCRLVCKGWLRSTSRVLLNCEEPLFRLSANEFVTEFISAVDEPSGLHDRVPPFDLRADKLSGICQSFHDCLVRCGSGLVKLRLILGNEASLMPDIHAEILFPNLVKFEGTVGENGDGRHNVMFFHFIQTALDACKKLKSFRILNSRGPSTSLPRDLRFPSTITKLTLQKSLPDNNLEALETYLPPHLKKIKLAVELPPLKDGIITNILEKGRKTLQRFHFHCSAQCEHKKCTTFRLPVMEKLIRLEIDTPYLELEQHFSSLEQLAPVLKHVFLGNQTLTGFGKWTESSCFSSVSSLKTSACSLKPCTNHQEPDIEYLEINLDMRTMENMSRAFPNLRQLHIKIYDGNMSVFKFIMKEMTNLKGLLVIACASQNRKVYMLPDFWDALLLGIPIDSVAALRKSPELWESLQEKSTVSIRNMKDLEKLYIVCACADYIYYLSSAVFNHGFLCMPNLTELHLNYFLRAPKTSVEAWRRQNREIIGFSYDDEDQS